MSVMARGLAETRASEPADLIASTIHLERVEWEALRCGAVVVMKRSRDLRNGRDRLRYHLRARTGHHTLSSRTKEWEDKEGRKIFTGPKDSDWFMAMKTGLRNQANTRRFPSDMPRVNSKGMKRATAISRRNIDQGDRLERKMIKGGLGQRFKGRLGQGSKDGRRLNFYSHELFVPGACAHDHSPRPRYKNAKEP